MEMPGKRAERKREELICCVALACTEGVGPATFRALTEAYGSCSKAVHASRKRTLIALPRISAKTAHAILRVRDELPRWQTLLDELAQEGIRIVLQSDSLYPKALQALDHPPPLLFVLGNLKPEDECGLAIVGTTATSEGGRRIAMKAARRAATRGYTVVSGLARGVDSAAHLGAVTAGGRTVAFPATGLRKVPRTPEFPDPTIISKSGALISPFPPDSKWQVGNAMCRNRLIAAMSSAVLVVESRLRGGATYTAEAAQALGKPVYAVSKMPCSENTEGNRELIRRGARPLTCHAHVDEMIDEITHGRK